MIIYLLTDVDWLVLSHTCDIGGGQYWCGLLLECSNHVVTFKLTHISVEETNYINAQEQKIQDRQKCDNGKCQTKKLQNICVFCSDVFEYHNFHQRIFSATISSFKLSTRAFLSHLIPHFPLQHFQHPTHTLQACSKIFVSPLKWTKQ